MINNIKNNPNLLKKINFEKNHLNIFEQLKNKKQKILVLGSAVQPTALFEKGDQFPRDPRELDFVRRPNFAIVWRQIWN